MWNSVVREKEFGLAAAVLVVTAASRLAPGEGCPDHRRCTAHAAGDGDGAGDAVQLAGAALHAVLRVLQLRRAIISHYKNAVRANDGTQPAANTAAGAVHQ